MNYEETIEYIHSIRWRGSKLGLERIKELLSLMGNPQEKLKVIHVAGTNGKGSVCAMLESVLRSAGYKTGLCISPYISRFNERMQINAVPIPDDELCEITEYVKNFAESMKDLPTEFEIVCAITFEYFSRQKCDYVVLEVGMGGRLDATNVISNPLVSVITALGLDHTEYLGDTIEKIAAEKCGIIKDNRPVVWYGEPEEVQGIIEQACTQHKSTLNICDFGSLEEISSGVNGQRFRYRGKEYQIGLLGKHQQKNAALVIDTLEALKEQGVPLDGKAVETGLREACWPGRFELVNSDPPVVVDGAHNPQGMSAAAAAVREYFGGKDVAVVIGVLKDKDYQEMLVLVNSVASRFVATSPDNPRALAAAELARALERFGKPVLTAASPKEAIKTAIETAGDNEVILALGSLYMVGELREYFA